MKTFVSLRQALFLSSWSLLAISLASPASAQDAAPAAPAAPPTPAEMEALRAQVNTLQEQLKALPALQKRLDDLEAQQKASASGSGTSGSGTSGSGTSAAPAAASTPTPSKPTITVGGLAQVQGLGYLNQDGPAARANDTFRLRRAEIRVTGAITPRVSALVVVDAAKALSANFTPATTGTGGTVAINRSGNILQDLQLSYLLRGVGAAAKRGTTSIDVGQYKIPVGYEGALVSSSAQPFVERSIIYTARDPFGGGYGDIRDTGVQLRGTQGQFDYRIGVFNGFGERQNDLALSDNKAILGLLNFHPTAVPGLQLGISGGQGNTRTVSTQAGRPDRNIFNAFAVYKRGPFTFQSEYLTGKSQTLGSIAARDIQGYYAGVGYLFTPKIEGLFRYDYLDTNRDAGAGVDSTVRDLILGVNYYIKGQNAKIQVNLVRRNGASGGGTGAFVPPADLRNDRTELRTQAQVSF